MGQRGLQAFITFDEFVEWLRGTAKELSLVVLVDRLGQYPIERWSGEVRQLVEAYEIYLATAVNELGTIYHNDVNPAERGWVVMKVPRVESGALLDIHLDARSDWYEDGVIKENPESIRLHGRIARRFKKILKHPVWAKNIKLGGSAVSYRSLGYSNGAREWYRNGGELMHEGMPNIRYEIRD